MPTPLDIGIDIEGIAAPLVDLAFGMTEPALVDANLKMGGTRRTIDPITDQATDTGGYDVTIKALLYSIVQTDTGDPQAARDAFLLINTSDLTAAGIPRGFAPRSNDKVLIGGNTWTVFKCDLIPTNVIYILEMRR